MYNLQYSKQQLCSYFTRYTVNITLVRSQEHLHLRAQRVHHVFLIPFLIWTITYQDDTCVLFINYLEPPDMCRADQRCAQNTITGRILAPLQFDEPMIHTDEKKKWKKSWMVEKFSPAELLSKQLTQHCQNKQLWVNPWLKREMCFCTIVMETCTLMHVSFYKWLTFNPFGDVSSGL